MSELIPIGSTDDAQLPVYLDPTKATSADGHWSSFDETTEPGQLAALSAMSGAAIRGSDLLGKQISVQNILVHVVQLADPETGEVDEAPRVVLIDPDGVCVGFCSMGAVQSLKRIIKTIGRPPWNPPLCIVPTPQKTRKGFTTIILDCRGRIVGAKE